MQQKNSGRYQSDKIYAPARLFQIGLYAAQLALDKNQLKIKTLRISIQDSNKRKSRRTEKVRKRDRPPATAP